MFTKLIPFLTAYPGDRRLAEWDDSWTNTLKFWDSSGENAKGIASTSDQVIKFYISNQPYLQADSAILIQMAGFVQNGVYNTLYALAQVSSGLIKAALAPLYYLPQMLMEPGNPLHILYYLCVGLGVSLVTLSVLLSIPKLSKQQGGLSAAFGNAFFTVGMMFVLPFIIASASDFTQKTLSKTLGDGTTSLAAAPMIDNTVDVENWAIHGFEKEPFSKNAQLYNTLEKADRPVPDFTNTVDKDDVELINKIAKHKNGITRNGTPIKDVGKVFQYSPKISPQNDNQNRPQYSLEKLTMEKGITHINDKQYKRYRVQNMPAILSYLVIIVVGALFAIKIMRATISVYTNLLGSVVAASRDAAKSTEPIKNSTMETLNSFMAIFLDVFLLFLFTYLSSSLPKQISSDYSGLMRGLVYAMVMGILAITTYNGSSALERQFGMTSGARGQGGILRSMAMPGAFLGSMAGGMMADKMRQKRNERVLESMADKSGDKDGEPGDGFKPMVNNGEKAAELLDADDTEESQHGVNHSNGQTGSDSDTIYAGDGGEVQNSAEKTDTSNDSSNEESNMNVQSDSGLNPGEVAAEGLDDSTDTDDSGSGIGNEEQQDSSSGEESDVYGQNKDDYNNDLDQDQGYDEMENIGEDAANALDDYDDEPDSEESLYNAGNDAAEALDQDEGEYANDMSNAGENTLDQVDADAEGYDDQSISNPGEEITGLDDYSDDQDASLGNDYFNGDGNNDTSNDLDTDYGNATDHSGSGSYMNDNQANGNSFDENYGQTPDVQRLLDEQQTQQAVQQKQGEFSSLEQARKQHRRQKQLQRLQQAAREVDQAEDPIKPIQ